MKKPMNAAKYALVVAAIAVAPLGLAAPALAQPPSVEQIDTTEQAIRADGRYAVLVSNAQHLNAAITTGRSLRARSQAIQFQIVACGKVVKEIATNPEVGDSVRRAVNEDGLAVVVCGMSVRQLNVDPAALPPEAPTTENGLTYLFGLQEQGFQTIEL
jgi:putative oxidoreductase